MIAFRSRHESRVRDLHEMGLTEDQIAKITEPELAFYDQMAEEIASYDRLRRGDESELSSYSDFADIGKLLIALRILRGMSQSDLAKGLGVDPSQISRDERNEYQGISLPRILKILQVLGVKLSNKAIRFTPTGTELECA